MQVKGTVSHAARNVSKGVDRAERPGRGATRGTREVIMNGVLVVTDRTFRRDVLEAGMPVLVDFWSPWSEKRDSVAETLELVAERYRGRVRVAMVNVEENLDVTRALRIVVYPTVALFMGDQVVDMRAGALPEPQYEALVEKALFEAA